MPRSTECKHLLKDLAFNSLQDRICLQNSLGGGEQTHSQPSVYLLYTAMYVLWPKQIKIKSETQVSTSWKYKDMQFIVI